MTTNDAPPVRRLYRRPAGAPLAGVCAGIAEYFRIDTSIVRIAAVVLAITGPGIPAYVIAAIVLPDADDPARDPTSSAALDRTGQVVGVVLLAAAVALIWGRWGWPADGILVPLALIGAGALLLVRGATGDQTSDDRDPPEPDDVGPAPGSGPPDAPTEDDAERTAPSPDTAVTAPFGPDPGGSPPGTATTWASTATATAPPWNAPPPRAATPPPPRPWSALGAVTLGAVLVWAGVAVLGGVALQTGLAVAVGILGLGLVAGSLAGQAGWLIVPGLALAGALILVAAVDVPLRGGFGDRLWVPQSLEELSDHRLIAGEATLDLTELPLEPGDEVDLSVSVFAGRLIVLTPDDATVELTARSGAGQLRAFGIHQEGISPRIERTVPADERDAPVLRLDVSVGFGQAEVFAAAGKAPR